MRYALMEKQEDPTADEADEAMNNEPFGPDNLDEDDDEFDEDADDLDEPEDEDDGELEDIDFDDEFGEDIPK